MAQTGVGEMTDIIYVAYANYGAYEGNGSPFFVGTDKDQLIQALADNSTGNHVTLERWQDGKRIVEVRQK
jgi:hypothetical protein